MAKRPVTVGTTPTQVLPFLEERKGYVIINNGSVTAFISNDQADILTRGFPLQAGASYGELARDGDDTRLELFAQVASGTADLRISEGWYSEEGEQS